MSIYDVQKMYIYYNCSASGPAPPAGSPAAPPADPLVAEAGQVLYDPSFASTGLLLVVRQMVNE